MQCNTPTDSQLYQSHRKLTCPASRSARGPVHTSKTHPGRPHALIMVRLPAPATGCDGVCPHQGHKNRPTILHHFMSLRHGTWFLREHLPLQPQRGGKINSMEWWLRTTPCGACGSLSTQHNQGQPLGKAPPCLSSHSLFLLV